MKLPEDIYKQFDAVIHIREPKRAPSRAKPSGMRSETFGELTLVDHGMIDVEGGKEKLVFLVLFDGATSLTTAYVGNTMNSKETISLFLEYFETYQTNPKTFVGDQAFTQPDCIAGFYACRNIRPIALGPGTPWPNRAEAAVRTFKKQVTLMTNSFADDPALADVTYRQLVRQACLARNPSITYGGVTPLEMAFGRRPADILNLEAATPSQLTSDVPTPEKKIEAVRMLATKAYLEAKQAKLNMSSGPFPPGANIFYWAENKNKITSDGSRGGKWVKGKLLTIEGSMAGIDLGTRIVRTNVSKIRKGFNPTEDVDIPLDLSDGRDASGILMTADAEQVSPSGHSVLESHWQPVTKGKIDFLELFNGSARLSHTAALAGLRVGPPIDLWTGFDIKNFRRKKKSHECDKHSAS